LQYASIAARCKTLAAKEFEKVLQNFLARWNMLESIDVGKLLQPITALAYVDCD